MMYQKYIITGMNKIKIKSSKIEKRAYIFIYVLFILSKKGQMSRLVASLMRHKEDEMINISNILRCFPINIYKKIDNIFITQNVNINLLEEIRIRVGKPIILKIGQEDKVLEDTVITSEEIIEILQHICDNSIYSYQNQICNRIYNNSRRT